MDRLIVTHDSILPKYRGFAPLVNMLINGEIFLGVTFLFASEKYDCGKIIVQKQQQIEYPIKINEAIEIVSNLFFQGIEDIYKKIESEENLIGQAQDENGASYSLWRNEDDYLINLNCSSEEIVRFVNATGAPYLGASLFIENQKVRILDAEIFNDVQIENRDIGKIIFIDNGKPVIICGKGLLKINILLDDKSQESILPLKKFRIKFKGKVI